MRIYGAGPDGNEFEIMWMPPRDAWAHFEHAAPVEPLDLTAELHRHLAHDAGVATVSE